MRTKKNLLHRFFQKVEIPFSNGCWVWKSSLDQKGYARMWSGTQSIPAYRFIYTELIGPIPPNHDLHHVCGNGASGCVNPFHLKPLTRKDHIHISNGPCGINARKTYCKHGHPLFGANLYQHPNGGRTCRICVNKSGVEYRKRKKQKKQSQ